MCVLKFCINYINVDDTFSIFLYNKTSFDVNELNIYTSFCTYFTVTLRDIFRYYYLLFNVIFGNISCISRGDNL